MIQVFAKEVIRMFFDDTETTIATSEQHEAEQEALRELATQAKETGSLSVA